MDLSKTIIPGSFTEIIDRDHAMLKPELLSRMTLLPHQRAAIAQLIWTENNYKDLQRRAMVYAENLGSGKTRVAIGLMVLQPIPPVFMPEVYSINRYATLIATSTNRRFLKQNVVIVKGDVYEAWKAEIIAGAPKLRVAYIHNARAYDEYMRNWDNSIFDVVLIKAGKMAYGQAVRSIVDTFAKTVNLLFARVIIDDYEQLSHVAYLPKALSYLAISTTSNKNIGTANMDLDGDSNLYKETFNMLCQFNSVPKIRCDREVLREWLALPLVVFRKVVIKARFALAMAFGEMEGEIGNIVAALAGDAYTKASKLLGITAVTPADVYQALMGKFYNRINTAKQRVGRLEAILARVKHLAETDKERVPFTAEMEAIIKHWVNSQEKDLPQLRPANGFLAFYKQYMVELQEELQAASMEVNITRQALAKQQCEVCQAAIGAELSAVIVKCCSKMACANCMKNTIEFWQSRGKPNTCPFNAAHRLSKNSIVYISEKMDLQLVANEDVNSEEKLVDIEKPIETPPPEPEKPKTELENKTDAIMKIIEGEELGELQQIEIEGLTIGERYIPPPPRRKIVVFVGWDETINHLSNFLNSKSIGCGVLCGTPAEIQKKIDIFREDNYQQVLIINSENHVSGFNLQFATDLVFYGKIRAKHVRSQAAGRIQRIGRNCSATIWQLYYDNEENR